MFAGIYFGGMYGSSTTAILLNTPGEAASIATAIEGYRMARNGRGGPALSTAAIGSFVAGTVATIGLALLAPWLVELAVRFGPWDYFALMVLAFVTVSATFGSSVLRGITSLALGLALGLVGIDKLTGQARLAYGGSRRCSTASRSRRSQSACSRWARPCYVASRFTGVEEKIEAVRGSLWMTAEDWKRSWKAWLRGIGLGFPIGALPAGGAEVPTLLSYTLERKLAVKPEEFGNGAIEGVAGPEAANNAARDRTSWCRCSRSACRPRRPAAMMSRRLPAVRLVPGPLLFINRRRSGLGPESRASSSAT
jgi:putative tricarboxylic transport membrane protein